MTCNHPTDFGDDIVECCAVSTVYKDGYMRKCTTTVTDGKRQKAVYHEISLFQKFHHCFMFNVWSGGVRKHDTSATTFW